MNQRFEFQTLDACVTEAVKLDTLMGTQVACVSQDHVIAWSKPYP